MDFGPNKPIYIQIYDLICERILSGEFQGEDRIPSVRDYGASIGVNPNTIMRAYEKLTGEGIIYNKRGIGYFISPEAYDLVLSDKRKDFIEHELPVIIKRMRLLGIDMEMLNKQIEQ